MTSACILKDTLRNDTQVFLRFRDSTFEICLHLTNLNCTSYFLPSLMLSSGAGTSKEIPLKNNEALFITRNTDHFLISTASIQLLQNKTLIQFKNFQLSKMALTLSLNLSDSDVSFVEQTSNEPSPQRNNSPNIFNSTEISHTHTAGIPSVSSIASPEPQILTIHDNSNEPTMPYGFGQQFPIVPPSLNDLNLPPNPFNILTTMSVVNHTQDGKNENYSPQSPEPSEPSPISTPSTFNSWEKSYTTTDDNTFYSDDEPRRIYFLPSTPTPPPTSRNLKRKIEPGNVLSKKRGSVAAHLRSLQSEDLLSKVHPRSIK